MLATTKVFAAPCSATRRPTAEGCHHCCYIDITLLALSLVAVWSHRKLRSRPEPPRSQETSRPPGAIIAICAAARLACFRVVASLVIIAHVRSEHELAKVNARQGNLLASKSCRAPSTVTFTGQGTRCRFAAAQVLSQLKRST